MRTYLLKSMATALSILLLSSCSNSRDENTDYNILFLHHSTGRVIWKGETSFLSRAAGKVSSRLGNLLSGKAALPGMFEDYNKEKGRGYAIKDLEFPKRSPYGWNNFPYDYYNIWVKHAGEKPYMEEPTLEMLTRDNHLIIFKHCFPVSNIIADADSADIDSDIKTLSNYKIQYLALRDKLQEFPETKFIVFTGAAQVKSAVTEEEALRAKEFFSWVVNEWDMPDDNIFIWDLYQLQTEGGLYFKDEYAVSASDSHPNGSFAGRVEKLLFSRIIDVIENDGMGTALTGEKL